MIEARQPKPALRAPRLAVAVGVGHRPHDHVERLRPRAQVLDDLVDRGGRGRDDRGGRAARHVAGWTSWKQMDSALRIPESCRRPASRGSLVLVLILATALGCTATPVSQQGLSVTTIDSDERSPFNPQGFEAIWPPDCLDNDRVIPYCSRISIIGNQFISDLETSASDEVIVILPDGRLRYTVRMWGDSAKEVVAETRDHMLLAAGWRRLPGSQLFHQAWERTEDHTGTFRLYLDFTDGPPLGDGRPTCFFDGRIETVTRVLIKPRQRLS